MLLVVLSFCILAHAHDEQMDMSQQKMPAAFEKLKTLVGTWTGSTSMHGKDMPYTVSYESTAGGTAILEREFVGTPKEMITVYTPQKDSVVMTHYCMLGNQPRMTLTHASGNTLSFMMQGSSGIMSTNEPHMHALKLTMIDDNHLRAEWTEHENGKDGETMVMNLTRKS